MSLRTKCPHCDREAVLVAEALGKNVRCKGCAKAFVVRPVNGAAKANGKSGSDPEMRAAVKAGQPTTAKARIRPQSSGDDDGQPRHDVRVRESKSTLWIGLGTIGAVTVLVSVLEFVLIVNRHPQAQAFAHAPPPHALPIVKQLPAVEAPPVVAKLPPKAQSAPVSRIEPPQPQIDRPSVAPKVEAPPEAKGAETPAIAYGDQGGESIAPAVAAPFTELRARRDDSFYQMANLRVTSQGDNPRSNLLIDFRVVSRGKNQATHLVIRLPGGQREVVGIGTVLGQNQGTIRVVRDPSRPTRYPEDLECILIRAESSFGNPIPNFLVSNAVRIGDPGPLTRARDWTPEEIVRLTKETPDGLKENAFPGVGVDSELVGSPQNGEPVRFVDAKGHLLGLEYRTGGWNGEACLSGLRPVYSLDQPPLYPMKTAARDGYAVSGIEIQSRNHIDAVKLHFRRIRSDGSLDPADSYEGPWVGPTNSAARRTTLGNTGRRVIGVFARIGAVVDGFALVLE